MYRGQAQKIDENLSLMPGAIGEHYFYASEDKEQTWKRLSRAAEQSGFTVQKWSEGIEIWDESGKHWLLYFHGDCLLAVYRVDGEKKPWLWWSRFNGRNAAHTSYQFSNADKPPLTNDPTDLDRNLYAEVYSSENQAWWVYLDLVTNNPDHYDAIFIDGNTVIIDTLQLPLFRLEMRHQAADQAGWLSPDDRTMVNMACSIAPAYWTETEREHKDLSRFHNGISCGHSKICLPKLEPVEVLPLDNLWAVRLDNGWIEVFQLYSENFLVFRYRFDSREQYRPDWCNPHHPSAQKLGLV